MRIVILLLLLMLTGVQAQEPWQAPVAKQDYPALKALVDGDPSGAQAWFDRLLQQPYTIERDIALNLLGRALGGKALETLRQRGILVDNPRWTDATLGRTVTRAVTYRGELARIDGLLDLGDYKGAKAGMQAVLNARPYDDNDAMVEVVTRNMVLQDCLESNDFSPTFAAMMRGVLDHPEVTGPAINSVTTARLSQARLARRADRPLEARRLYQVLAQETRETPWTLGGKLIAQTYLLQDQWRRDGYPPADKLGAEMQRWLGQVDFARVAPPLRPALAEALATWAEMAAAAGAPLEPLQARLRAWEQAGVRQATYARLRAMILKDPLPVVEAAYDKAADGLSDAHSQELLKVLGELRAAQARAADGDSKLIVVLNCYSQAREILQEIELPRQEVDIVNEFTPYLRQVPIYATFSADNDWALEQSRLRGYRKGELQALINRGDYELEAGHAKEALASYEQAAALFEAWVGELGAGPNQREQLKKPVERIYKRIAELKLAAGQGQDAFLALVKQQQAELLLGQDPMSVAPLQPALRAQEGARSQADEVALAAAARLPADPEKSKLLAATKSEFFATVRDLRQKGKNYEGMLAIQPVEFAQLQQNLPEGTLLVQYYPTDEKLYMFLVSRTDFKIRTVDVSRATLDQTLSACRQELVRPARERGVTWADSTGLRTQLETLYGYLIAPAAMELQGARTVAVVPTGMMLYLPFGALYHDGRFLAQDKEVVTMLRAADLARLARPVDHGQRLLALGNPDGTLAGAEAEVRSLGGLFPEAEVYVGGQADLAKLEKSADFVHLATHAGLNSQDPNKSYLVLGSGRHLVVDDIFELPLGKTRLVTLSACQTEVGERQPGAALSSLAEAFWVAGSPTLVASLWKVDDTATQTEMVEFYSGVRSGKNLAQAMQGAQARLIADASTAHPFYWAAFTVIGDWR